MPGGGKKLEAVVSPLSVFPIEGAFVEGSEDLFRQVPCGVLRLGPSIEEAVGFGCVFEALCQA